MLKSGIYNVAGAILRAGINVISIPLLIVFLGLDIYGVWSLVFAVLSLIAMVEGGLSVATTVFFSRNLAEDDTQGMAETLTAASGATLFLATILAIGVWGLAPFSLWLFPRLDVSQEANVSLALGLSALAVWPRLLQQIAVGVEQAFRRYDLLSISLTIQSFFTNAGMLVVAWRGGGVVELMLWHAAAGFGALGLHTVIALRLLRAYNLAPRWNLARLRTMGAFTGSTWLTLIGTALFTQVDRLIVGALLGPRALGIYAAVTSLTTQINVFSSLPVQPLLPEFGRIAATETYNAVERPLRQAVLINGVSALGIGGALLLLAPMIVPLLIPSVAVEETVRPFQIATAIYAVYSLNAVGYFVLLGLGSALACMGTVAVGGSLALVGVTVGALFLGLPGAMLGNVGYFLTLLLNPIALRKLRLPAFVWLRWLRFPLLWFVVVACFGVILPPAPLIRVVLLATTASVIIGWFLVQERTSIAFISQMLRLRRE